MHRDWWAGVDIGGTKTAVVLSADPPQVAGRIEFATEPHNGPDHALNQIYSALRELLSNKGASASSLGAIGISCGGPLNRKTGIIHTPPNLPTWVDVPIVKLLVGEFGCPVSLENDANAGAVAEHRFGAGKGFHNVVFLTLGTGLGSGIILEDRLYHGTNDMAGEIGHVRLTRSGPVGYNKAGSAEGWASGGGIAQLAEQALRKARLTGSKTQLFAAAEGRAITTRDVGMAAQAGDAIALQIVRTSGKKLGMALSILIDVLNPDCIVVGGLAVRLGDLFLGPARGVLKKEALGPALDVCRVVPSQLGEQIGDVSALCVAMDAGQAVIPV